MELGACLVEGSLALGRFPGLAQSLDHRTALLAAWRAAELSGCRWCIDRTRHECRMAGLSLDGSGSERDRAALAFVEAIARVHRSDDSVEPFAIRAAEDLFHPAELAELARIAADHHCLEGPLSRPREQ